MLDALHAAQSMLEMSAIDPRHHEFPCRCLHCGAIWSIYRMEDVCWIDLHEAASTMHRMQAPKCKAQHVRVAQAVPYGEAAPKEFIEHAASPFIPRRQERSRDLTQANTGGGETTVRRPGSNRVA